MKQFSVLTLLCLTYIVSMAQTPEVLLQKVQQEYSAEKIFVHYDKPWYTAGETIWFKAYLMNGYLPSRKSTVFYFELLTESGQVVAQRQLPIMGSAAVGDFAISQNLPSGNYVVKAYTRNLMNIGYENFYYHQLIIHNAGNVDKNNQQVNTYRLDFFPEGGNLVANIKNMMAFKCTDQYGRPASVEGKIRDAAGTEKISFKSDHDGMGKFEFTPKPGETYIAESLIEGAFKSEKTLPPSITEAVGLIVSQLNQKKYFSIDASTITSEESLPAYVLGAQENIVVFKVPVRSKRIRAEIPSGQLLTGILQLTVFNKNNQPLAERLVFINSGDYLPEVWDPLESTCRHASLSIL